MRRSINDSSLIVTVNPKSPISEVYRTLRTNIQYSSLEHSLQIIMVTSSVAGEGKTTTVSNLAVTYAQEGKKVLLIDADMRKPSLHQVFEKTNRLGLSTILSHPSSIESAIQDTIIDNLSILPSGPIPENPSELLSSENMREFLTQLRDKYEIVLIDTPPILAVIDGSIISTLCDGVILVAGAGRVKKQHLNKAIKQLEHVNASMIGFVLNQTSKDDQDIFYMKYYG
ncbi:CpsD/CapB family tyrosine-protein kinase [Paenibacillus protaetiae]|uniref:non-specific protein-tyrosine kinase n=1 Tax=Paenibacillus protaetiae TaxID=2509456 RepID=A0A4P6EX22_9BACL|nr:CpsD/CapB family tyrosine-protein kinase [Paenibacillus protaetiae]QAY66773.1 polysaccharide biosynthesis tyrosine autokinase [Paenibacillus protaetiae]